MNLPHIYASLRRSPLIEEESFQVVILMDEYDKDVWLLSSPLPYEDACRLARTINGVDYWQYAENHEGPFGWRPEDFPVPPEDEDEPLVTIE